MLIIMGVVSGYGWFASPKPMALLSPTNTISGRAEVVRIFWGMVVGGLSVALHPSRSPCHISDSSWKDAVAGMTESSAVH